MIGLIDHETASRALAAALSKGGDHADLFAELTTIRTLTYEEGKIKTVWVTRRCGAGVHVVDGEHSGFSCCDGLDPVDMIAAAHRAAAIAGGGAHRVGGLSELRPPRVDTVIRPASSLDAEGRGALCREAWDAATAVPRITWVQVSIADTESEVAIAVGSREGEAVFVREFRPMLRFSVSATAVGGERRESGSSGGGGRVGLEYFERYSPAWHGTEAARKATTLLDAVDAPVGSLPVLLAPGSSGILVHEAVGHGLEGDFNRKGVSAYSGRVGEMVASPLVTIVDDGLVPGDRGSIGVDDEGVPAGRTVLIESGRLHGYLHDRQSARLTGNTPTGNGRREDYRSRPIPRMRVTTLAAGEDNPDEILASVRRGLLCVSFGGGSVDIVKGDFNFRVAEGYLIEDGRVGPAVRGAMVIGNGPETLRRITRVGSDLALADGIWTCGKQGQGVPVGQGLPTTLVSELLVGGTA